MKVKVPFIVGLLGVLVASVVAEAELGGVGALAENLVAAPLPSDELPPDMVPVIEEARRQATFTRTLDGPRVAAPLELYGQVIDLPEVSAPAARRLGVGGVETVTRLSQNAYRFENQNGSWVLYRVLHRSPHLRITHAQGEEAMGPFSVRGQVWGLLRLASNGSELSQSLVAFVQVESKTAALFTRFIRLVLPGIADRELLRGFMITRMVSEWAYGQPDEFCRFLVDERLEGDGVEGLRRSLPGC